MRNLLTLAFSVSVSAFAFVACSSDSDDAPAPLESDASSEAGGSVSDGGSVEADGGVVATEDSSVSADTGVATDAGNDASGSAQKRVFVSSQTFSGDLKTAGAGVTGADGANKLCNTLATTAALGGTWKAWVSVVGTKAADRLVDVGGWRLVGPGGAAGSVVFANLAATSGAAAVAINHNETGVEVGVGYPVWTGTLANGGVGQTCLDWTSGVAGNSGTRGAGNGTVAWTENNAAAPCNETKAIYCFEQ